MKEELRNIINQTEKEITATLQKFIDRTGLRPEEIDYRVIDSTNLKDMSNGVKKYFISELKIKAST